jgi:hypothetical protein
MEKLNLPSYPFRYKDVGQRKYIFDSFRKKYVLLTPEEYVRQHFATFLVKDLNYPAGRIALEVYLRSGKLERRCDIVIYDSSFLPVMIIECKGSSIEINEAVFDQVVRYNMALHSSYIAVTNGIKHFCCIMLHESGKWKFLDQFPAYPELMNVRVDK